MNKCGICNEPIPLHYTSIIRREDDGTLTLYCCKHEGELKETSPCPDCGKHRKLCDECAEF